MPDVMNDIRDIKGPLDLPSGIKFVLIALAVIVAGYFMYMLADFLFRMNRKRIAARFKKPHEIALEKLDALMKKGLFGKGMIKEFYVELTDILRRYIESRFELKAPEMTTEEFLANIRDFSDLKYEHKNLLREFLQQADLVKFAKYGPSEKELDDSMRAAKSFVEETRPVEAAIEGKRKQK